LIIIPVLQKEVSVGGMLKNWVVVWCGNLVGGLFAKMNPTYADAATAAGVDLTNLTWGKFFAGNLLPVTLGNIVGGVVLVGVVCWFCYLHGTKED
jgi:formate/nitrite transporter FocA (FNT family)